MECFIPGVMPTTLASAESEHSASSASKPTVIGLYGISGAGKSTLLRALKLKPDFFKFLFFEGSSLINDRVAGGLEAFQQLPREKQDAVRRDAIDHVREECSKMGRTGIVTGHFSFWNEAQEVCEPVYTESDLNTYTHIIYLDFSGSTVFSRRINDKSRFGNYVSIEHLDKWRREETRLIRELTPKHGILTYFTTEPEGCLPRVVSLIHTFHKAATESNSAIVKEKVSRYLGEHSHLNLQRALVIDGDRTLSEYDTGDLFWGRVTGQSPRFAGLSILEEIFSGPLGYSEKAFWQATLACEETVDEEEFRSVCYDIAHQVYIHSELANLLERAQNTDNMSVFVVTCGLGYAWELILAEHKLSACVIGGGRIADGLIVTPETKAAVVGHLQSVAGAHVWSFGDSPLDMPMLMKADDAIVVVGDPETRSSSMDEALEKAFENPNFHPMQTPLPRDTSLLLKGMPVVYLNDEHLLTDILTKTSFPYRLELYLTSHISAARLLESSMRNASISGPALREAHRRVGHFLALLWVAELLGGEEYDLPHVQGFGHRLRDEEKTTIMAMMRGGEPMALGVNDAFPQARFVHGSSTKDIEAHHLKGQSAIILVDSVVNTGQSMVEFVQHLRLLNEKVRIIVVAGVIHAGTLERTSEFFHVLRRNNVAVVALRTSENKFMGTKGTDTGNRLFNTMHLA